MKRKIEKYEELKLRLKLKYIEKQALGAHISLKIRYIATKSQSIDDMLRRVAAGE